MLFATPEELSARREQLGASADLAALEGRLRRLLLPWARRPLFVPSDKALLSRDGGVCPDDGARLVFDPLAPYAHRCPICAQVLEGERHYRAWVWRYHLWLSERAIHLSLLAQLRGDSESTDHAAAILRTYATVYPTVPNRDNVLGPTRLFFSTYLESIWLTQLVIAASLLDRSALADCRSAVDAMVRESSGLIASFNETWSNRQVWHNTALVAAGRWLGGTEMIDRAVHGPFGLVAQLRQGVTADGLWYEGENYHFFALRGFLLAAELLRGAGVDLYAETESGARLRAMYVAPLSTLLPDLTLPARGDGPYGVSVVQPRFAELWEIGWCRTGDVRLESLLADLYSRPMVSGDDCGFADLAEQEENRPACQLARELLSWKALLWMRPDHPAAPTDRWQPGSVLLSDAGVAVLRVAEERYVSLECGGHPGGHGHPDLLHMSLFAARPYLADFGTGSYVLPSLHWYRSTAAHNAPTLAGKDQVTRQGWCSAFAADGVWGWCQAVAPELFGKETAATRTVVAGPAIVVDRVDIVADDAASIELSLHPLAGVILGDSGLNSLQLGEESRVPTVLLVPRHGESLRVEEAPGPPSLDMADGAPLRYQVRRASGSGVWVQVISLDQTTSLDVQSSEQATTVTTSGGTRVHIDVEGREVRITERGGTRRLRGRREPPPAPHEVTPRPAPRIPCRRVAAVPTPGEWEHVVSTSDVYVLGERQYRRSEEPYATGFVARVAIGVAGSSVWFAARVSKPTVRFQPASAASLELDNEEPDIHSDGIQCYLELEEWEGYVGVPQPDSADVRIRAVAGSAARAERATGKWEPTPDGYSIVVEVASDHVPSVGESFRVNLIVNEMTPGRVRRAGQLALAGGGGWVYLRGDRESPWTSVIAEVV
jgi:hypothetical protein